jgi:hypothetical protein
MLYRLLRPLLRLARLEGDVRAAARGPAAVGRRLVRRHAHRALNRGLNRVLRPRRRR